MKFRYLGLFALAPVLSQCQPACAPIPDGNPIDEPTGDEVTSGPVDTAAPVTIPATMPTTPVTTPTTKPVFEDQPTFGFHAEVFAGLMDPANCPSARAEIGWNASANGDLFTHAAAVLTVIDADTGREVAEFVSQTDLPVFSDAWVITPPLVGGHPNLVVRAKVTFSGALVPPATTTVYSDEWRRLRLIFLQESGPGSLAAELAALSNVRQVAADTASALLTVGRWHQEVDAPGRGEKDLPWPATTRTTGKETLGPTPS